MKTPLLILLLVPCFLSQSFAQKHDTVTSHVDAMASFLVNASPHDAASISGVAKPVGFFGTVSYAQSFNSVSMLLSGYLKVQGAAAEESLQPLYDQDNWDVTNFTSEAYFSSGLLWGVKINIQQYGDYSLPDFYFNLQAGFCNVHLPERNYEFSVPDGNGGFTDYKKNYEKSSSVGTALNFSAEADVLHSQNAKYNVKLGLLVENAKPLSEFHAIGGDPYLVNGYETFLWSSLYAYLGISVKFGL